MAVLIDVGYWAWDQAYAQYKAAQEGKTTNPYHTIEKFIGDGTILAFDGRGSLRKDVLPWYKLNRADPNELSVQLRELAEALMVSLNERYPNNVYVEYGLEADDIIAKHAKPGDIIWSNDKDYLQLPKSIYLTNFRSEFWGVERFKTHFPVKRGCSALAFQLMYGDPADNIPRRFYGTKEEALEIFESKFPLYYACCKLDVSQVRTSLAALALPTPLIDPHKDIIDQVIARYEV